MGQDRIKVMGGLCLLALATLMPELSRAEVSAAEIKAAFVFNFAKFVEWPERTFPDPNSPILLCVAGDGDGLERQLSRLEGKEAQGRLIRVRSLGRQEATTGCHILVLEASPGERAQRLQSIGHSAVLTIADSGDFPREGGMIGLFVIANRVQFSVNLGAAQGAGLKLSSRMLQLAYSIQEGTP